MAEGGWMVGSAKTERGFGEAVARFAILMPALQETSSPLAARESAEFTFPRSRGNCKHADVAY